MSREHFPSLKEQMILAMTARLGAPLAKSVFEHDLWPVLDAAMTAGELLVARNTVPQKPVHEALVSWLEVCLGKVALVHEHEATASKRELLNVIYQFEENAARALADAKQVNERGALLRTPLDIKH